MITPIEELRETKQTTDILQKEFELWLTKGKALETQSKEAFHNAEIIKETIRLMKHREKMPIEIELPLQVEKTEKYKGMTMAHAIFDALTSEPGLKGKEIYQRLEQNGYETASKTLQRDIYTRLYNLDKHGKIVSFVDKGFKCYKMPENKQ
jgi:hypothetical protein